MTPDADRLAAKLRLDHPSSLITDPESPILESLILESLILESWIVES